MDTANGLTAVQSQGTGNYFQRLGMNVFTINITFARLLFQHQPIQKATVSTHLVNSYLTARVRTL